MKLQMNISDDLAERIDRIAKLMGVSRSALCAVLIGQWIMTYDMGLEQIDRAGDAIIRLHEEGKQE